MLEKLKKFYNLHLYTKEQIYQFYEKDKITFEQYQEIVNEETDF